MEENVIASIRNNTCGIELVLNQRNIDDKAVALLADALKPNATLTALQ
eukprot:gene6516-7504_t